MDAGKGASTNNVRFLKTDPKARYQGYRFFFKEGFCWIDVNSIYLKARLKGVGVFDVLSMSLFTQTQIPDSYFVAMINSDLISMYVDNFINNTSHFQINDARQLPIVIPSYELINRIVRITSSAITSKQKIQQNTSQEIAQIQEHLDYIVKQIYGIK